MTDRALVPQVLAPATAAPPEADETIIWLESLHDRGVVMITDHVAADRAGAHLRDLTDAITLWDRIWKPALDGLNKAKAAVLEIKNKPVKPLELDKVQQVAELRRWELEKERLRRAEEDRLRAEQIQKETATRAATIQQLEAAGQPAIAEEVRREPILPAAVTVPARKTAGVGSTPTWTWKPLDVAKAAIQFHAFDTDAVDALVKKLGPGAERIVGLGSIEIAPDVKIRTAPRR